MQASPSCHNKSITINYYDIKSIDTPVRQQDVK